MELQAEYGGNSLRFWNPKLYDENDEEIEIPFCEDCNCHKAIIMSKSHSAFACPMCGK